MTTTTNTYTRQDNPSSSYFHLPILLHPDQTAMDLLQHTQDTYRDACLDIVKFFKERNIYRTTWIGFLEITLTEYLLS